MVVRAAIGSLEIELCRTNMPAHDEDVSSVSQCPGRMTLSLLFFLVSLALLEIVPDQNSFIMPIFVRSPTAPPHAVPAMEEPWSDTLLYAPNFVVDLARRHARAGSKLSSAQDRSYALGTAELQAVIRRVQFPSGSDACSADVGRFFISYGPGQEPGHAGIGAMLQIVAMHLSISVGLNRTLVWADNIGNEFSDEATCGDKFGFLCFLRPPSSCTLEDALMPGADTVHVGGSMPEVLYQRFGLSHDFIPQEAQLVLSTLADTPAEQPEGPSIMRYMWRAQCAAFLMLLNDKTLADLRSLRLLSISSPGGVSSSDGGDAHSGPGGAAPGATGLSSLPPSHADLVARFFYSIPPPLLRAYSMRDANTVLPTFPLRRGTISMHIRHGDKASEMRLVPTLRYFEAAAALQHSMALALVQQGFVSTEDPDALIEINETISRTPGMERWVIRYSDIPRINSNGLQQLNAFTNIPRGRLTQLWLLQLLLALECDAWVGTRGSNWNKLIDQLRCVWVPKCGMPYVEVGNPTFGTRL